MPEFLYNIGQAYRLSNRAEKALQAYKAYLRMSPDAPNHVQVEKHIVSLQALVNQQRQNATAPPTSPRDPPGMEPGTADLHASTTPTKATPPSEPPPTVTPPTQTPTASAPPMTTDNALTATAPHKTPITKKPWFWGVVGGGAVVVVGAVVLGVVLGTRDNTKVLPDLRY